MNSCLKASFRFCAAVPVVWLGMLITLIPGGHPPDLFYLLGWSAIALAGCGLCCAVFPIRSRPEVWFVLAAIVVAVWAYLVIKSDFAGKLALLIGPVLGAVLLVYYLGAVLFGRACWYVVQAWLLTIVSSTMAVWTFIAMILFSI
jgi:hypothetical protein